MRTTTQKLEWPARPSRRTASTGRKYREWVSTPAAYRVTKFVGDYQPFVAWKWIQIFDDPTQRRISGFEPIGEFRTLKAAQRFCGRRAKGGR